MNKTFPETINLSIRDPFMGGSEILTIKAVSSNNCFILVDKDQEVALSIYDIKSIFDLLLLYMKG